MYLSSRQLLDNTIDRRTFIRRMAAAGVSLMGAQAMADGRPYLVDVVIERRFDGKDSDWFEFFSVARNIPRQT
jgi:hypothetical protein